MKILIVGNTVEFPQEILEQFPEITGEVNGNTVTINNVWKEQFVGVVGEGIFWEDKQEFLSFSIIFTNGNAKVEELSALLVRYVNYHDKDFSIYMPMYQESPSKIQDPLGLGVRPNYYGLLASYLDGNSSLDVVAETLEFLYNAVLDNVLVSKDKIILELQKIPREDMVTFLTATHSAMDVFNLVTDATVFGNDGTSMKSYDLSTAGKDLRMSRNGEQIVVTTLCIRDGEQVQPIREVFLRDTTTITECVLNDISCQELTNSKISDIFSDFGAYATIERPRTLDTGKNILGKVTVYASLENGSLKILSDFIFKILSKVGGLNIDLLNIKNVEMPNQTMLSYSVSSKYLEVWSQSVSSVFERVLVLSDENPTSCSIPLSYTYLNSAQIIPTERIMQGVTKVSTSLSKAEYYFAYSSIDVLSLGTGMRYEQFNKGHFKMLEQSDFAILGTPLGAKISTLEIGHYGNSQSSGPKYDLMAIAIKLGYTNMFHKINSSLECGILDGAAYGFKDVIFDVFGIMDAGIIEFDALYNEIAPSLAKKQIQVETISDGYLLICSFGKATNGLGYFESGAEGDTVNRGKYEFSFSTILANGMPITNKESILKLLMGSQEIRVNSAYSVRNTDLEFIKTLLENLRKGYKTLFRASVSEAPILETEDKFSYEMLTECYEKLIKGDSWSEIRNRLRKLAQGGAETVTHTIGSSLDGLEVTVNITKDSITKDPVYIQDLRLLEEYQGSFSMQNGEISVSYGDIEEAYEIYYHSYSEGDIPPIYVLANYTLKGNILTLYYAKTTFASGVGIYLITVSIDLKSMTTNGTAVSFNSLTPLLGDWGVVELAPIGSEVTPDSYVEYTVSASQDGEIIINYQAYNKEGEVITNEFNTLTLGNNFLHKEVM